MTPPSTKPSAGLWGLRRALAGALLLGLALVYTAPGDPGAPQAASAARVVAVGDVHGAYPDFVAILERVGLIDANRQWSGGSVVLVQTGDVPDRGSQSRAALDLLIELEPQAAKQQGRVIALLGNHEVMNILGDLRYVSVEDYRNFATDQSEKVRAEAYEDYRRFLKARGQRAPDDEAARQQWMADHPPGFFEQRDGFGPQGVYGRWLRQHDAIAQVGDTLFMHGGLNPKLRFRSVEELNRRIRSELASFDALWQWLSQRKIIWRYMKLDEALHAVQTAAQSGDQSSDPLAREKMNELLALPGGILMAQDSPLWYRGLALEPEEKLKHDLDKMFERLHVRYLVAAHTVQPKYNIAVHFDHRVFLIDTGMLKPFFGGRASALEIENGRFTAYYANAEKEILLAPDGATPTAGSPGADGGQGGGRPPP